MTEGCVNETFSAAIALWQARRAAGPEVRAAMAAIAEDELSHAQLAWDVHLWASRRLGPAATEELEQARAEAARHLLAACARPIDPDLVTHAGFPDAASATGLALQAQPLWS